MKIKNLIFSQIHNIIFIQALSFCEIGRRYAVSDNTIRKWCKGFDLPFKKSEIANYTDEDWSNI